MRLQKLFNFTSRSKGDEERYQPKQRTAMDARTKPPDGRAQTTQPAGPLREGWAKRRASVRGDDSQQWKTWRARSTVKQCEYTASRTKKSRTKKLSFALWIYATNVPFESPLSYTHERLSWCSHQCCTLRIAHSNNVQILFKKKDAHSACTSSFFCTVCVFFQSPASPCPPRAAMNTNALTADPFLLPVGPIQWVHSHPIILLR